MYILPCNNSAMLYCNIVQTINLCHQYYILFPMLLDTQIKPDVFLFVFHFLFSNCSKMSSRIPEICQAIWYCYLNGLNSCKPINAFGHYNVKLLFGLKKLFETLQNVRFCWTNAQWEQNWRAGQHII